MPNALCNNYNVHNQFTIATSSTTRLIIHNQYSNHLYKFPTIKQCVACKHTPRRTVALHVVYKYYTNMSVLETHRTVVLAQISTFYIFSQVFYNVLGRPSTWTPSPTADMVILCTGNCEYVGHLKHTLLNPNPICVGGTNPLRQQASDVLIYMCNRM